MDDLRKATTTSYASANNRQYFSNEVEKETACQQGMITAYSRGGYSDQHLHLLQLDRLLRPYWSMIQTTTDRLRLRQQ